MSWFIRFIASSIGKKQVMAVTGFCFLGFLSVHLAGNLTLFGGPEMFKAYAEGLHSLGPIIIAAELGLLALALAHVSTGIILFIQNRRARPRGYAVSKSAGGKTLSSTLMPYTGLYLIGFITIHLMNFTFADRTGTDISELVTAAFHRPLYIGFYLFSMLVVALHVRHGLWSAFQTVGANHPRYMPAVRGLSVLFALVVGLGFGALPIWVLSVFEG